MEEDQFSGEEPFDDTDNQRLHETILSIEKSLEETNENLERRDVSRSLESEDDKRTTNSDFSKNDTDVDAPLPELELSSAQKIAEPETPQTDDYSVEEDQASLVQGNLTAILPSPSKGTPEEVNIAHEVHRSSLKDGMTYEASGSPDKTEASFETSRIPERTEMAFEASRSLERTEMAFEANRSPETTETANDVSRSPIEADVAHELSQSPVIADVAQETSVSLEKTTVAHEVSKSLVKDGVPYEGSQSPINEEVVQLEITSLGISKSAAVDFAYLRDSQSLEDDKVSRRKKRQRSPEKEVVESHEGDDILSKAKKLKTPPKESGHQTISTQKVFKKRGRPSLADKMRRNNSENLPQKVDKPKKSKSTGKEDIIVKTTPGRGAILNKSASTSKEDIAPMSNKSTTSGKEDISCKKNELKPLRRPRRNDRDEDTSPLFLPEDWVFMAVKRQAGTAIGKFDVYYITPPPRIKLRSRQELVAYMNNHGLNYDPLDFFRKSNIPFLLKQGTLKYCDPKTIVSSNADEVVVAQLMMARKAHKGLLKTESGVIPITPIKAIDTKTIKSQKRLLKEKASLKRKYRSKFKSSLKKERLSARTKLDEVSPEPVLRKARERSTVSATKSQEESVESVHKELKESNSVIIKSEIVSPDTTRKTRLRSSTGLVEPPALLPVKATRRSTKVLEIVENAPSPKTPLKGRPGRPRKSVPPPPAPESDTSLEQRKIIQSKPKIVRSPYFSSDANIVEQPVSSAGRKREKNSDSAPPRSPFNLIQEDLFHDPWQMLISTIFLNSTSGRIAIPLALEFLKRWPTPQEACQAKLYDILDVIEPLGFGRTRAAIIIRFSHEFLTKDWKLPSDLYGIGKYGTDSYKIFCMKDAWKNVESDDPLLMMYLNWRRATEHLRKKFLMSRNKRRTVDPDAKVINTARLNALQAKLTKQTKDQSLPLPRKRKRQI
ncbi:uncharacterized protein LOC117639756 [Thrips palmi]|uniref:Methyl-CpG-binding domain protein 4 n=1 Tax=Thrips palmi TaxID=161013 RepID=A0A6P8Y6A5_THRPL|nr:uncharacterized protein LOC117639756 [Thrips palmi]